MFIWTAPWLDHTFVVSSFWWSWILVYFFMLPFYIINLTTWTLCIFVYLYTPVLKWFKGHLNKYLSKSYIELCNQVYKMNIYCIQVRCELQSRKLYKLSLCINGHIVLVLDWRVYMYAFSTAVYRIRGIHVCLSVQVVKLMTASGNEQLVHIIYKKQFL